MPVNAPEKPAQGFLFALNPYLGDVFMTAPFTDAAMPEVCARVAYAWVRLCYKRVPGSVDNGTSCVIFAIEALPLAQDGLIRSALLALLFHLRKGGNSRVWRSTAITNSRAGCGFRRCWYDDYKANRRDPRVTNRGVIPSLRLPGMD